MTRYGSYGTSQKPIRRDRVAIAIVVLAVLIAVPVLLIRSCDRRAEDPVDIIGDTGPVTGGDGPLLPGVGLGNTTAQTQTPSDTLPDSIAEAEILSHEVEDGETLTDVALALGVSAANLRASNGLYGGEALQPGEILYAAREGVLHTIKSGQTLTDISLTYVVPIEEITRANGISADQTIRAGERLLIPTSGNTYWENVVRLSGGTPSQFIWPLLAEVVSEFGWRDHPVLGDWHHHDGIDLDVPEGTLVYASASGEVFFYGEQPGYGNVLILEHGDGYYTMYGHLSGTFVQPGRFVEAGQGIAQSGNTGISSGPHLHFEIRNGQFPINPLRYLP